MQVPFVTSKISVPILGHAFYKVEQSDRSEGWTWIGFILQAKDKDLLLLENSGERLVFFLHNQGRYTNLASTKHALATVQTRFIVFSYLTSWNTCLEKRRTESALHRKRVGKGRNHHVSNDLKTDEKKERRNRTRTFQTLTRIARGAPERRRLRK